MTAIIQRPLRGSRISTFYPVKNLPSLASLDSAFQLQEYISLLIRLDVHDVNAIVSLPGNPSSVKENENEVEGVSSEKKDGGVDKGKAEPIVDEACWIYEQLRRLAQDLSHPLITTLQQECTRASCPEMKAGEWLYLCVAHGNDGAMEHCCAIDYILHTVDSATALLNSPRTFPSRLQIPVASHRHFSSLARRLGRIFAHAYFHHREAFEQAEAESSLYARFLALTERFDLVPAEFLVIPMDGHNVGEQLGLGHPASRSARDDHRRSNEFDRGYHQQQQQQRTRYSFDLGPFRQGQESPVQLLHSNISERNPSPPGPSSPESGSGGIGESPSLSARARFGRHRTGTMVFAEAEANAVTDELAARSSMRERELEPQKIELLERDGDSPVILTTTTTTTPIVHSPPAHEDEEARFEINLSPEAVVGNGNEGGESSVALEAYEESPGPVGKDDFPSLLELELEPTGSALAEPEANVSAESSSTKVVEREKEEVTPASTPDIVAEEPAASPVTSVEVKPDDDDLESPIIPTEMTTPTDIPPIDDNISIPKDTPETAIMSMSNQEIATKLDDKATTVTKDDDELPAVVPVSVDVETPILVEPEVETKLSAEPEEPMKIELAQVTQPGVALDAIVEPSLDAEEEEKSSIITDSTIEKELES